MKKKSTVKKIGRKGCAIKRSAYENNADLVEVEIAEGVKEIEMYAFAGCSNLVSVKIPAGVSEIGCYAFAKCKSLKSVEIPADVKLGFDAFNGCSSLESIVVPPLHKEASWDGETVSMSIPRSAFADCTALLDVVLPEGLTEIGDCAFSGCVGLKKIHLPKSVKTVGDGAFENCTSLESIDLSDPNLDISRAIAGCTKLNPPVEVKSGGKLVLPDDVKVVSASLLSGCGEVREVVVPQGVVAIDDGAFMECECLERVVLPKSLKKIGSRAFFNCSNLSSVEPVDLGGIEVDGNVFAGCSNLPMVRNGDVLVHMTPTDGKATIPDGISEIGSEAFEYCTDLTSVEIPASVVKIGFSAFSETGLTSVSLPEGVSEIGYSAFSRCKALTAFAIPSSLTRIENAILSGTSLTKIVIPATVLEIGEHVFMDCVELTEVVFSGNAVKVLSRGLFENCTKLSAVVVPDGVEEIGADVFVSAAITKMDIPASVKNVGRNAFASCKKLKRVYFGNKSVQLDASAFYKCKAKVLLGGDPLGGE